MLGMQERGIAWTIRDVANAAYLTPSSSPLKAFFTQQVDAVIQNLDSNYVHGALGAEEGQLQGYIMGEFDTNQVAPWEQGYIVIALGQAAAQGFAGATDVLAWMNNFIAGLYLNGANGYNPLEGSGYWLTTGSGSLATGNYQSFTSWQQLFAANFAGQPSPTALNGFPDDPVGGFSTIAKAALAVEWNVTHATEDLAAYAYITQQTAYLIQNTGGYDSAQTWDIAPTLTDGHQLQNSEVTYGAGGTTISASVHGLLAAVSGNNILQAGSGDSILIGGSGNDQLKGGAGDDFLFAGTGTQSLYGGGGNNTLQGHLNGGSGVDTFLFKVSDIAQDTVLNFKPGVDMLEISGAAQGVTLAGLLAAVTTDAAGDTLLHLSPQHEVILTGIHPAQLTVASLTLI
jgi:Ca2+-binding RTX toxin-like protein